MIQEAKYNKILIVDDNPDNIRHLSRILDRNAYDVRIATSGEAALKALARELPDMLLLDVRMPEMSGFELLDKIIHAPTTREIQVIFISAMDDLDRKIRAFQMGAVDYITKPFVEEEVLARLQKHMELHRLRADLKKSNHLLQKAIREKEDVFLIISHDLAGPINLIAGYSELALRKISTGRARAGGEINQYLEQILAGALRLREMSRNLLETERLLSRGGVRESLDLARIVKDHLRTREIDILEKEIEIIGDYEGKPALIFGNTSVVTHLLANILENSLRHSPPGGVLAFRIRKSAEGHVTLDVSDQGPGFPPDGLASLSGKFVQSEQMETEGIGFGVGLWAVQRLCEEHNIGLELENSEQYGGARVRLIFYDAMME